MCDIPETRLLLLCAVQTKVLDAYCNRLSFCPSMIPTHKHRHMNIYLNREIGNKQGKSNNNSTERIRKFISKSGAHKLCHIHIQPTLLFTKRSGKRCSDNAFQMTFRAHFKYSQIKTFNLMINYQN